MTVFITFHPLSKVVKMIPEVIIVACIGMFLVLVILVIMDGTSSDTPQDDRPWWEKDYDLDAVSPGITLYIHHKKEKKNV